MIHFNPFLQYSDSYCSQKLRIPLFPIKNLGEGERIISQIIAKNMICPHDVMEINYIYQEMQCLERKFTKIPNINSNTVLLEIVEKIKSIMSEKIIKPSALISLYHLQFFSDELQFSKQFANLNKMLNKDPSAIKSLATLLPYCHSEEQFNKDAEALFGYWGEEVEAILRLKREKHKNHQLRHPPYFVPILDNKFFHLYDHLIKMKEYSERTDRKKEIEKLSFSQASHIILQTKKVIIKKVEDSLPCSFGKNILFLLGGTQIGKSTTFCFLRKDEMVLQTLRYESKNDQENLIGNETSSCTFLPNVEIFNDWAIVDFPGFSDSHGQLISLGMECALKALIKKYQPKVLVLESINNNETRSITPSKLKELLERLFKNPTDCLLGITKYSKHPQVIEMKKIEEEYSQPTNKEEELRVSIDSLIAYKMGGLEGFEESIQKEQTELEIMVNARALEQKRRLEEKRLLLKKDEEKLVGQIGMKNENIIHFNLEDNDLHSLCFKSFSSAKAIHVQPDMKLAADDWALLDKLSVNLKNLAKSIKCQKNIDVWEKSLIATLFSSNYPEIVEFLHLPEIDPQIVRKYAKEIIEECSNKFMDYFIYTLDMERIQNKINEVRKEAPKDKLIAFEMKLKQARDYILGLYGKQCKGEEEAKRAWAKIWKETQQSIRDEGPQFPSWIKSLIWGVFEGSMEVGLTATKSGIEYGLMEAKNGLKRYFQNLDKEDPFFVYLFAPFILLGTLPIGAVAGSTFGFSTGALGVFVKWYEEYKTEQENIKTKQQKAPIIIEECCQSLDQACELLFRFKDIEKHIAKQDELNKALESTPISTKSQDDLYKSIVERINKVQNIYGVEDWERRVCFMANKFLLENFSMCPAKDACLLSYAYLLIVPNLFFHFKTMKWGFLCYVGPKNGDEYDLEARSYKGLEMVIVGRHGIGIISSSKMPFLPGLEELRKENRPVMRALFAAALLKANAK